MCTLSIIPCIDGHGARATLIFNRDEQRSRAPARPPVVHAPPDATSWVGPIDPQGGGTWIGASERGVCAALLNVNPARVGSFRAGRSRGEIVPDVLRACDWRDALVRARELDPRPFLPFRLVLSDGLRLAEVVWNGFVMVTRELGPLVAPVMRTSSGLGDELVIGPRQRLFDAMVVRAHPDDLDQAQRAFHGHRWESRPELSVHMSRDDARTVSRTTVVARDDEFAMIYEPETGGSFATGQHAVARLSAPSPALEACA